MKATDQVRRIEFRYLDGDTVDLSQPLLAARSVIGAKARRMSFFLTTPQILARTKTVTRRAVSTWTALKPGDRLVAIEKGQGLKAGEGHNVLALLEVVSVRVEQLDAITADDCAREGFPGVAPAEFVRFFLQAGRGRAAAEQLAAHGAARTVWGHPVAELVARVTPRGHHEAMGLAKKGRLQSAGYAILRSAGYVWPVGASLTDAEASTLLDAATTVLAAKGGAPC